MGLTKAHFSVVHALPDPTAEAKNALTFYSCNTVLGWLHAALCLANETEEEEKLWKAEKWLRMGTYRIRQKMPWTH
jgi:hypothetical protein